MAILLFRCSLSCDCSASLPTIASWSKFGASRAQLKGLNVSENLRKILAGLRPAHLFDIKLLPGILEVALQIVMGFCKGLRIPCMIWCISGAHCRYTEETCKSLDTCAGTLICTKNTTLSGHMASVGMCFDDRAWRVLHLERHTKTHR